MEEIPSAPSKSASGSSIKSRSPKDWTGEPIVFAVTVSVYWARVSKNGLLASVSSIQFTENSSPRQEPISTPFTVSSGAQQVAHEDKDAFDAVKA